MLKAASKTFFFIKKKEYLTLNTLLIEADRTKKYSVKHPEESHWTLLRTSRMEAV